MSRNEINYLLATAGSWLHDHGLTVAALVAGVAVGAWWGLSCRRDDRTLARAVAVEAARRWDAEWRTHRARMDRWATSSAAAARVMDPQRVTAVAKVPTGGMQLAGSDLPPRGTHLPDLADTGVFVSAEVAGMEALARRGQARPDRGYGRPPRIAPDPANRLPGGRHAWSVPLPPALVSPAVLEYTRLDAARQVAAVLAPPVPEVDPAQVEPQSERERRDDDDPPAPPVLTRSVTATTIRRASHWPPARMLRNLRRRWGSVVDNRPGWVTPEGLRILQQANRRPSPHAGRHHLGVALGAPQQNVAQWAALAASGPRRCVR